MKKISVILAVLVFGFTMIGCNMGMTGTNDPYQKFTGPNDMGFWIEENNPNWMLVFFKVPSGKYRWELWGIDERYCYTSVRWADTVGNYIVYVLGNGNTVAQRYSIRNGGLLLYESINDNELILPSNERVWYRTDTPPDWWSRPLYNS